MAGKPKYSNESFKEYIKDKYNGELEVLGEFTNTKSRVLVRCTKCGFENNVLAGHLTRTSAVLGCKRCSKPNKKSHAEYVREFDHVSKGEYELISKYVGCDNKVDIKHKSCGYIYPIRACNFLRGDKCPKCQKVKRWTHTEYEEFVSSSTEGEYTLKSLFRNTKSYVTIKHTKCNHSYKVLPTNFTKGHRCPKCNESKGEKAVEMFLKEKNLTYATQFKIRVPISKKVLKIDFIVEGVAIEYDGMQHFKSIKTWGGEVALKRRQALDRAKTQYCADNGIPLIRIPYWDFDNIDAILTEKLLPLLAEKAA